MNASRARELFSAYRESTLDAALRMAFERTLQSDAQLQAEYRAFTVSLDDLELLRHEEIEPPVWLSDRIATRLDAASAGRSKAPAWWGGWFRNVAFGGLAVAVLGGAVVGILSRGGNVATGSFVPSLPAGNKDSLEFHVIGDRLEVSSPGAAIATSGGQSSRFGGSLKGELTNGNPNAAVFSLQVDGKELEIVALPGTQTVSPLRGEGTMVEFAQTLASVTHKPVRLASEAKETRLSWDLSGPDAMAAAGQALQPTSLGADQQESGEIAIR